MTKVEAASKVVKLRHLAVRAGSPHEADTAKKQADKLIREHDLRETDISAGAKADAFDDLLGALESYVRSEARSNIPLGVIIETFSRMKNEAKPTDKARAFDKIVQAVRAASLFFGDSKQVAMCKDLVDLTLRKHDVTV